MVDEKYLDFIVDAESNDTSLLNYYGELDNKVIEEILKIIAVFELDIANQLHNEILILGELITEGNSINYKKNY